MPLPPATPKRAAPAASSNGRAPMRATSTTFATRWLPTWLGRDLALLFAGRALRSLAQGYLAIIVPLFLAELGFSAEQLGVVFAASAVASALLAAGVGLLSDRFGRKTFLILISLLMAAGGLVFALTSNFAVLVLAGALGTIGRGGGAGSGGAWGPYYPAEQALIAEHAPATSRTSIFGALSFAGVLAGALGSLLALVPPALHAHTSLSLFAGERLLFLLTVGIGIAMAVVVLPVREAHGKPNHTPRRVSSRGAVPGARRGPFQLSRQSWGLISRFMVTNATNGLAIGMLGSFVVYWFYRRYGVGASEMGTLFFIINLAAALPYLLAGRLARRLGAVRTVVLTRAVSVVLLFCVAIMPTFALAAGLYLVRMVANTLSNPVRQSYLMGIIAPEERASAAGLSNLPSQICAAISPTFAGYLMQQITLDLPLELAAALQGLNAILYYAFFHAIRPPEEQAAAREPSTEGDDTSVTIVAAREAPAFPNARSGS